MLAMIICDVARSSMFDKARKIRSVKIPAALSTKETSQRWRKLTAGKILRSKSLMRTSESQGRQASGACARRPAGGSQPAANIDDVLRQIIREELAALQFPQRYAQEQDQLLTASEAAKLLQVSERWLYKHASKLPYAVRLSETVVRFSRNKIQAEIRRKLNMQR